MSSTRRTHKVASLLHSELARLLVEEVSDPRLQGTVITDVELSHDLQSASVFYAHSESVISESEISRGFERALPFFKRKLGALKLRYIPELIFQPDTQLETASRVLRLLDETRGESR